MSLDYLLVAAGGLTIFMALMLLLQRVLIASMAINALLLSLPFG